MVDVIEEYPCMSKCFWICLTLLICVSIYVCPFSTFPFLVLTLSSSCSCSCLQSQLGTIIDEQLDLSACLDIYSAELRPLFPPNNNNHNNNNNPKHNSELGLIVSQTLSELRPPSSTKPPSPVDPKVIPSGDNSSACALPVPPTDSIASGNSFSSDSSSSTSSNRYSDASNTTRQFPDLDRSGRPKQVSNNATSTTATENKSAKNSPVCSDFPKKREQKTDADIWSEIKRERCTLKVSKQ